jgi:hypothetical protein
VVQVLTMATDNIRPTAMSSPEVEVGSSISSDSSNHSVNKTTPTAMSLPGSIFAIVVVISVVV